MPRTFLDSPRRRAIVISWSLFSGIIHVVWELSWSLAAPLLRGPEARHGAKLFWTLYGLADYRYLHADPFVRALEFVTGTVVGTLNIWVAAMVWRRRRPAAATMALLIASVMEVYGTILYFGSELFGRFANVDTTSFVHTWVMFFGLNALWLLFPGWCIYEIVSRYVSPRRT
ncbi:MAG: EXPERA domain-containing protein [Actinomycetota bacterium]